ncbi:MAG: lytic transglycosylase domain-containing protein [Gammaproteobacteria bacterium]|nr:MAG: lytic transglycosylase domain-containing protein [Gammaproteobacteria bacterium]
MIFKSSFIIFVTLLPSLVLSAGSIQRVENEKGVIEFSNVSSTKKSTGKQTIIYKYPQSSDLIVFTDQKPSHTSSYEVLKFDCFACDPHSTIDWNKVRLNLTSYSAAVKQEAKLNNIDPALVRALIHAESAFNAKAVSKKGAQGLMQLMPATAKELGVDNALNAEQNIAGGAKYLAQLLRQFNGDIQLATAAYNAGPGAVRKYNGIPPYSETQVYVERVGILHRRYQNAS